MEHVSVPTLEQGISAILSLNSGNEEHVIHGCQFHAKETSITANNGPYKMASIIPNVEWQHLNLTA